MTGLGTGMTGLGIVVTDTGLDRIVGKDDIVGKDEKKDPPLKTEGGAPAEETNPAVCLTACQMLAVEILRPPAAGPG